MMRVSSSVDWLMVQFLRKLLAVAILWEIIVRAILWKGSESREHPSRAKRKAWQRVKIKAISLTKCLPYALKPA